jgi:hypothetical protein
LTTQDLLRSLDPDGTYMEQAMQAGIDVPTDGSELVAEPTDDDNENDSNENGGDDEDDQMALLPQPQSLSDMAQDNIRRREVAPVPAVAAEQAFAGTTLHQPSCTLWTPWCHMDVWSWMLRMLACTWIKPPLCQAADDFFQRQDDTETDSDLIQRMPQGMVPAAETGSSHAKVGDGGRRRIQGGSVVGE